MDAVLVIACPACSRLSRDELELLEEEKFHAMRCAGCTLDFLLLVAHCASCQAESVHTWTGLPLEEAHCRHCGSERI
jgi:Zn ribbon nucleic-acid-binding protein